MQYLLSRIHKLNALTEVLERYVNEAEDINSLAIKADARDISTLAEEIASYDIILNKKIKKTIDNI